MSERRDIIVPLLNCKVGSTGDDDIVVSPITSQITQTAFDVEIIEWQQAGLTRPSVVRLHKLNTIEKSLVNRQLGILLPND